MLAVAEVEYRRCLSNAVLFNRADAWDTQGGDDDDNRWATEAEAQAAIDDLVAVGFDANELRIALAA